MTVSVIVPTYNERENVGRLVGELLAVAPGADVCLLDDASPDGTADHAEELYGGEPRFSVLRRTGARNGLQVPGHGDRLFLFDTSAC